MGIASDWYHGLDEQLATWVRQVVFLKNHPTEEQLLELQKMVGTYAVDSLKLAPAERARLDAAFEDLFARLRGEEPPNKVS